MDKRHWNSWVELIEAAPSEELLGEFLDKAVVQLEEAEPEGLGREQLRNRIHLAAYKRYEEQVRAHESEGAVLALKDEFGEGWWNEWKTRHPKPPTIAGEPINKPIPWSDALPLEDAARHITLLEETDADDVELDQRIQEFSKKYGVDYREAWQRMERSGRVR